MKKLPSPLPSLHRSRLLCAVTGALLGAACKSVPVYAVPPPTAQWSFDEGTGKTTGSAIGSDAGTLQGNAGWGAGLVGAHALNLAGRPGDFVDVPRSVVDTTRSFTIAAAVKLNKTAGFQTFVSVDGERISGFFLQFRDDTREFAFTVPSADGTDNVPTAIAASHVEPESGVWYHLVGVYDADARTVALYVNGALQETVPVTASWRAGGHLAIGRAMFAGNPVDFVDGSIDDVRVYSSALPVAEALALAKADLPPGALAGGVAPLPPASLSIHVGQPGASVNPMLYGLMTEEINYSYDGGLYGELIQNRAFRDDPKSPTHWSIVPGGGSGTIALDTSEPLNAAQPVSLKWTIANASASQPVGVANTGYWGIPVKPGTTYRASFYAKAAGDFSGSLTVGIESSDGATVYAKAQSSTLSPVWKQYTVTLKTGNVAPTAAARFVISARHAGTVWLGVVSLFPPTFHNRPNGNRPDLMEKMAALKPAFLRFPGGNYLEGDTIADRFDWKRTLGSVSDRPGHRGPWNYRSTDGMGLMEFLDWCDDLHMEPLLAVYAGYSLNHYKNPNGQRAEPGAALQPFVQDALDEIEFLTGATSTKWGAERARLGHPLPFKLHYVEIGNEDGFDASGSYDARFAQFYDAIKAKYPTLQCIATAGGKDSVGARTKVTLRKPDLIDEHYYASPREMEADAHRYDHYDRSGPKIFVGEWASQDGRPTPNLNSMLGDAAWLTGIERNADIVPLECYAPLLVNVNPGGSQWGTNLIGYDALTSFGSPSYYMQAVFAHNVGDAVVPSALTGKRIFASVTRNSKQNVLFVKMVNAAGAPQSVDFRLDGVGNVASVGAAITLRGNRPTDTNTLAQPTNIVPVTASVNGLGSQFHYTLPPYSVTVLQIHASR